MIYKIQWVEKKAEGWIVATLEEAAASTGSIPAKYLNVSLNKIDKKTGTVAFPDFDNIQAGRDIEGEIWQSPKGGWYLFPPRPQNASKGNSGAYKGKQIEEAQTRKAESIEKFQGNKEESIRLASAQRDAVLIVTQMSGLDYDEQTIKNHITNWRNWFLSDEFTKGIPPF